MATTVAGGEVVGAGAVSLCYATKCTACQCDLSGGIDTYGPHDQPFCFECWHDITDPSNQHSHLQRCHGCKKLLCCEITYPRLDEDYQPTADRYCEDCYEECVVTPALSEIDRDIMDNEEEISRLEQERDRLLSERKKSR